jgi:hypothetical protein
MSRYRPGVGPGLLVALTLPGLVLLLVVLAVAEQLAARLGRRSPLAHERRHALSAGGLDVFSAALAPGRAVDLEQRQARELRRNDVGDGAPPRTRIDLDSGVAYL